MTALLSCHGRGLRGGPDTHCRSCIPARGCRFLHGPTLGTQLGYGLVPCKLQRYEPREADIAVAINITVRDVLEEAVHRALVDQNSDRLAYRVLVVELRGRLMCPL